MQTEFFRPPRGIDIPARLHRSLDCSAVRAIRPLIDNVKSFIAGAFFAGLVSAAACGPSGTATYDPESNVHAPDWLPANHVIAAREDISSCQNCHGEDFAGGGISKVSCDPCHLGGPLAVHPASFDGLPWLQAGTNGHGLYVTTNGTSGCKNVWCHGTDLEGIVQSGPACSACHPGEAF